ncbi:MAG: peptidylprolyl isomerase [Acidimicrobiia bacterium]
MSKASKRERQRQNREAARTARLRAEKRAKQRRLALTVGIPVLLIVALLFWFGRSSNDNEKSSKETWPRSYPSAPPMTLDKTKTYRASIKTSEGDMEVALDAKNAPIGVNNFVFLARNHFYDGLTFHRVVKDFMIQGGDPNGDGSGGPGYTVQAEVPTAAYEVGTLAYAKTSAEPAGTAGSQFFVVTGSQGVALPKEYASFGKLTKGTDVAHKIEALAPSDQSNEKPTKKVTITSLSITEDGKTLAPTVTPGGSSSTSAASTTATAAAPTTTASATSQVTTTTASATSQVTTTTASATSQVTTTTKKP